MLKNGKILSHHNLLDIINAFVRSSTLTNGWKFNYDPNEKRHFCGYKAWQEYEQEMLTSTNHITGLKTLVLPVVFMDDFLKDKSSNSKVMSFGIYMTLANLTTNVSYISSIITNILR